MTKKIEYERWRQIFITEQKGKSPENSMYQPVPEISIPPYLENLKTPTPEFRNQETCVHHSFMIDAFTGKGLADQSSYLKYYSIKNIYQLMGAKPSLDPKSINSLKSLINKEIVTLPAESNDIILLGLGNDDILHDMKWSIPEPLSSEVKILLVPGHDFLWNMALVRGLYKHAHQKGQASILSKSMSVFIPLHLLQHSEIQDQLIPLSSQLMSLLISGINHFVWDLRNMTEWQSNHLNYLLNIPEILQREGKILAEDDSLRGSFFMEELSNKVHKYLRK